MDICDRIENWVFNNYGLIINCYLTVEKTPQWTVNNYDIEGRPPKSDWNIPDVTGVGSDLESAFNEFLAKLADEKKIKG